jgi:hypothetical protein
MSIVLPPSNGVLRASVTQGKGETSRRQGPSDYWYLLCRMLCLLFGREIIIVHGRELRSVHLGTH